MGNWTPEGFVGQMFKTFAKFIAPSGMPAPVLWGDEKVVRERLGAGVAELRMTRRHYNFDYPFPPANAVELFRRYYGPTNRAFGPVVLIFVTLQVPVNGVAWNWALAVAVSTAIARN